MMSSKLVHISGIANPYTKACWITNPTRREVVGELIPIGKKIKGSKPKLKTNTTAVAKAKQKTKVTSKDATVINNQNQSNNMKKKEKRSKKINRIKQIIPVFSKASINTSSKIIKNNNETN